MVTTQLLLEECQACDRARWEYAANGTNHTSVETISSHNRRRARAHELLRLTLRYAMTGTLESKAKQR